MKVEQLVKGKKYWCPFRHDHLYFTGVDFFRNGYNIETKDYTPQHLWKFKDITDAVFVLTQTQVEKFIQEV